MIFTSPVRRSHPPQVAGEVAALTAWLDYHRATLPWKLKGLDDEQLRRSMVPSGLSLLGLVKHLTAVEHVWFVMEFANTGEPHLFESEDDPDLDFHVQEDETTEAIVTGYLRACERSRDVVAAATSLDETFRLVDRSDPRHGQEIDLRWILLHMIEETARHNGHADILRELIDGSTGD
ncbi:MAG: DinB family protein [Actinomycetota bacterium]